jgi:predicted metal-dependent hydrolase
MGRKSLSSQVMEEIDRIRGNLGPLTEITDPMTAHVIGEGLEGLHRIETMCLAAIREKATAVMANQTVEHETIEVSGDQLAPRRRTGAHKAPRTRKAAEK